MVGIANAATLPALTQLGLDDGTTYYFGYPGPGSGAFAQPVWSRQSCVNLPAVTRAYIILRLH